MLAALTALAFALADEAEPPPPKFKAALRKTDDKFESSSEKGAAVWKITSKSGIGGATVSLESGAAPKKLVIRFAGIKNLESFGVQDGELKLQSRLERGGGKREVYFDDKGKMVTEAKTAAGSLVVQRKGDDVEVVLSNPKPGKKWTLSWVNEYRR
jgi:polygalacturonase